MKIKLTQKIKNLKGENLKDGKVDIELKAVCVNALLSETPEKEGGKVDGNEKMKRFLLAEKIEKAKELDLKAEEIAKIKAIVGGSFAPLIVGRVYNALEGKK